MSMSYDERKALLSSRLKPSRFRHSLGVADTAAFLADRFGVDVEQAREAGATTTERNVVKRSEEAER